MMKLLTRSRATAAVALVLTLALAQACTVNPNGDPQSATFSATAGGY